MTEPYHEALADAQFLLLQYQEEEYARHYLEKYGQKRGELEEVKYQNFTIRQLMDGSILEAYPFDLTSPYYTLIDGFVLLSNSRTALEIWLDRYLLGQTLDLSGEEQLLSTATETSFWYFHGNRMASIFQYLLRPSAYPVFKQLFTNWPMGIVSGKTTQENHLAAAYTFIQAKRKATRVIWKKELLQEATLRPQIVAAYQKEIPFILLQDANYMLYCLETDGRLRWKRQLQEAILEQILSLPLRRDGELQLLFNTRKRLYLLDQDGKDLESFPKRLQSPASKGLTLVDFEADQRFSYFLGCENGNLYGWEADGTPVPGWNPRSGIGVLKYPLQHFPERGKDYFVAITRQGTIYLLGKDGQTYQEWPPKAGEWLAPRQVVVGGRNVLIILNTQGTGWLIDPKGGTKGWQLPFQKAPLQSFLVNTSPEGSIRVYAQYARQLRVYQQDRGTWRLDFKIDTEETIDELLSISSAPSPNFLLALLSHSGERLYLFDENGQSLPDFPIAATLGASICRGYTQGEALLLTVLGDQVYAYTLGE